MTAFQVNYKTDSINRWNTTTKWSFIHRNFYKYKHYLYLQTLLQKSLISTSSCCLLACNKYGRGTGIHITSCTCAEKYTWCRAKNKIFRQACFPFFPTYTYHRNTYICIYMHRKDDSKYKP